MVKFISIQIEGFGSFQKEHLFNLDRQGINLIYGNNGDGKTTIFSALMWALYKINLKGTNNDKVATWEKYRLPSFRGTRVIVNLEKDNQAISIARHLKFKGLTQDVTGNDELLVITDEELSSSLHKGDLQEEIIKIIGVDSKIFLNSALFGQHMKRLVEADPKDKRELLENIFDMAFISNAKDKAKLKIEETNTQISAINNNVVKLNANADSIQKQIDNATNILANFEDDKADNIKLADEAVKEAEAFKQVAQDKVTRTEVNLAQAVEEAGGDEECITELEEAKKSFEVIKAKVAEMTIQINTTNSELSKANTNIRKYTHELDCINDNCPTCNKPFDDKEDIKAAKQSYKDRIAVEQGVVAEFTPTLSSMASTKFVLDGELSDQGALVNLLTGKVEDLARIKRAQQSHINLVEEARKALQVRSTELIHAQAILAAAKSSKPPKIDVAGMETQLAEIMEAMGLEQDKLAPLETRVKHLTFWESKAFSAKGIKAYIFSAMLVRLNNHAITYANRLGLNIHFDVDLTKASAPFITTIHNKDGVEVDYNELSGGFKNLTNIVMAFALHDLISAATDINILILDEIFENLDATNVELVFELIQLKAETKSVFLISHQEKLDTTMTKSFTVKMDEDRSSYIE